MGDDFEMIIPEYDSVTTDKIALIDADFFKHTVSYAISKLVFEEQWDQTKPTPVSILKEITDTKLHMLLAGLECKSKVYLFSGRSRDTFRGHVAQEKGYKIKRKERPLLYDNQFEDMDWIFQYIRQTEHCLYFEDLEADDLLSMLQCHETFIVSKDKDAKQIPGVHFDLDTFSFVTVTEDEGFEFLMKQVLIGDSTDNISGLPRMGPVKVDALFNGIDAEQMMAKGIYAFIEKYGRRRGLDMWIEMYELCRLRLPRGEWLRDKYKEAFNLIETLKAL